MSVEATRYRAVLAVAAVLTACGREAGLDFSDASAQMSGDAGSDATTARDDASTSSLDATIDGAADVANLIPDAADDPPIGSDGKSNLPCYQFNCAGCCSATGECVTQQSEALCGSWGNGCVACPAGAICQGGACLTPVTNCGPSNCEGCCKGSRYCSSGIDDTACGQGGQACETCGGSTSPGACAPQPGGGGQCGCYPSCRGCCVGNDCFLGLAQVACGTNGETCQSCPSSAQCAPSATSGGMCVPANPACNSTNCMGCCQGDVCAIGDQDIACGGSGENCLNCAMDGDHCIGGACVSLRPDE